ncbi:hypothetical protein ADL21_12760 [Streptomyces albus subsp. albus]|nr:hypothetical protein ADL21_12760 [Streptomyces albus subsp. albus]
MAVMVGEVSGVRVRLLRRQGAGVRGLGDERRGATGEEAPGRAPPGPDGPAAPRGQAERTQVTIRVLCA